MDNKGYISVLIDTFTPCIKDNETGELIDTEVIRIKRSSFLKKYNKANGWYVNWSDLVSSSEIYALVIKGTVDIQGLVSIQNDNYAHATYIQWMCASPQNNKEITPEIKYSGIGGHLFAIAGKCSVDAGYQGDVYGFAANEKLLQHYIEVLGAIEIRMLHEFHFGIFEEEMKKIMEVYEYDWTDDEI